MNILKAEIFDEYLYHKQTFRELSEEYNLSKFTISKYVSENDLRKKIHNTREIFLVVDATYFGKRIEGRSWCVIVFRDPKKQEDLWWKFCNHESDLNYAEGLEYLKEKGYTIKSVTADGLSCIRRVFRDFPFQMCHVHMERIIVRGTTQNPQLEAGKVLLAIIKEISTTKKKDFQKRAEKYFERYKSFLNEKSFSSETGEHWFTHEELRRSAYSLFNLLPYLFTYRSDLRIPNTTNSLEAHFRHLKNILGVHPGLKRKNKEKLIHEILISHQFPVASARGM